MARYSIEDTTLTAIGDAIRERVGETRVETIPFESRFYYELDSTTEDFSSNGWEVVNLSNYDRSILIPLHADTYSIDIKYSFSREITGISRMELSFIRDSGTSLGSTIILEPRSYVVEQTLQVNKNWVIPNLKLYQRVYKDTIYTDPTTFIFEMIQYDSEGNEITTQEITVTNTLTPIGMAEAINNMPPTLPDSAFNISGACLYKFYGGGWDWFLDLFGDKIVTDNISSCNYMFGSSKVEYIPFDLGLSNTITAFDNMFYGCSNLKELPNLTVKNKISIPTAKYNFASINGIFGGCQSIREIPEDYFDSIFEDGYMEARERFVLDGKTSAFSSCYSLRKVPYRIYYAFKSYGTGYYYSLYSSLHSSCYALDEAVNLPVEPGPYTSNAFSSSFSNCRRLGRLTFETNEDGTAKAVNWKSQTIDLSSYIGYSVSSSSGLKDIINYNSGITADKEVTDAASYEALKNDPDWFTRNPDYSRYNRTSAVETINTLPDVSGSGGTNTIKFKGAAGAKTDGGAINTMTDAEIAVAAAKGWTVTMS